ncbi:Pyruvate decarboxylase like protein [Verticillium longisporum]|uniref:Pyruvate decarboxylase n=1 Tax=Verticillium longisporum TaxID=100787 RepID=A0A8I3A1V8_VERLO|nr:Pyruvate decarboxylase like protein [Verticillium longisporum]
MASTVTLADYLFGRLRQLGVGSIHGVPGDYNLELLDYVEPAGLRWVGNANELNAAYAADAYARIKGIGAVITTFGVGELSAVNGIAGAYAEFAPVVHIVGIPPRSSIDGRLLIHHTFNDGEYRRFAAMHAHVTVAQACLTDPRTSAEQIDDVLRQCLLYSRPVYIEVPVDMVAKPLSASRLESPVEVPQGEQDAEQNGVLETVLQKIYDAKKPVIFVDGESRPLGICKQAEQIVEGTKWPTWTTPFGKSLTNETLTNFHGIYQGKYDDPAVQRFIGDADLILIFGPHFSSTNTSAWSSIPNENVSVLFTTKGVQVGGKLFRDVSAKTVVSQLASALDFSRVASYSPYPELPRDKSLRIADMPMDEPLEQSALWKVLAGMVNPGDIVLGETGTAGYGVREMPLPPDTRLFTPVTWLSIGYMLPGAQGAALAQRELLASSPSSGPSTPKTILFIGDGSFQMTVQEIATIVRLELNVVIFLINNDGYTIERCIHGRNQAYNDVSPLRYLEAPSFFGAKKSTYTASARTWRELQTVLDSGTLHDEKELRMVEIFLGRDDAPKGPLLQYMISQKEKESAT